MAKYMVSLVEWFGRLRAYLPALGRKIVNVVPSERKV